MDVLLIGSGGREHAIAWKLKQSKQLGNLYIAPGNAGTAQYGQNVDIRETDIPALVGFAREKRVGLVVVGPEDPLAK
ncbi:MAG TPA: phosphoribosylamine--glycine ligase family protein, partial [Sedimentisphaerales bacterium]|nr:phosphoribosylamine--glycine ligase family protein [Sedimentisphaerales bacterium]